MGIEEFVEFKLKKKVAQMGTVSATAKWIGCSDVYLHHVLHGKIAPGPKILDKFFLEKEVRLRRKR